MSLTLAQLAQALTAILDPTSARSALVEAVGSPRAAGSATLLFAETEQALAAAQLTQAAAVLTQARSHAAAPGPRPVLLHPQPKLAFALAARLLRGMPAPSGIHPSAIVPDDLRNQPGLSVAPYAVVGEGCRLGPNVRIDAGAILGPGCVLGENTHIHPRAVLYPGTVLGARCVVHAGAVLGADGFGYVRDTVSGTYTQFPQQGRLVLEDDVEIGANTTVDRGALEETRICRGTKIDNLVHIGHNVTVGADVVIAAQTGISGSSSIGDGAIVAGQVGIADHVAIGPGAVLGAQCGVPSNKRITGPGQLFWGTPARPIAQYLRELAILARLGRRSR